MSPLLVIFFGTEIFYFLFQKSLLSSLKDSFSCFLQRKDLSGGTAAQLQRGDADAVLHQVRGDHGVDGGEGQRHWQLEGLRLHQVQGPRQRADSPRCRQPHHRRQECK